MANLRPLTVVAGAIRELVDTDVLYVGTAGARVLGHVGFGDSGVSGNVTVSASETYTGDASRYGISQSIAITDATLTAGRTHYGSNNLVTSVQFNNGAFTQNLFGGRNAVYIGGATDGGTGDADTVYGTQSYVLNRAATTGGGVATITNAYGAYNWVQNTQATGAITNAYGTFNRLDRDAGTLDRAYGVYNSFEGTIRRKIGLYNSAADLDVATASNQSVTIGHYDPATDTVTTRLTIDTAGKVAIPGALAVTGATTLAAVTATGDVSAPTFNGRAPWIGSGNRIINGHMLISQRWGGGVVLKVPTEGQFPVDRWTASAGSGVWTTSRPGDGPNGIIAQSLKLQVTTPYTPTAAMTGQHLMQIIEKANIRDLSYGFSSAQPSAASFWVKSSIAGKYSAFLYHTGGAGNNPRTCVVPFTINTANVWEYKTVTFPGDTGASTWPGIVDNIAGVIFGIDLGSGTQRNTANVSVWQENINGFVRTPDSVNWSANTNATFNLTGVQFDVGTTVAQPFQPRMYAEELLLCQRYFQREGGFAGEVNPIVGRWLNPYTYAMNYIANYAFRVSMRTNPSMSGMYDMNDGGTQDFKNGGLYWITPNSFTTYTYILPSGYFDVISWEANAEL